MEIKQETQTALSLNERAMLRTIGEEFRIMLRSNDFEWMRSVEDRFVFWRAFEGFDIHIWFYDTPSSEVRVIVHKKNFDSKGLISTTSYPVLVASRYMVSAEIVEDIVDSAIWLHESNYTREKFDGFRPNDSKPICNKCD